MPEIPYMRFSSKAKFRAAWQGILLCHAAALLVSPLLPLAAVAQTTRENVGPTTILPTDIVPLGDRDAYKTPVGELLQLKIMQRLPSRLYFSSSIEVTGRNETNPFQFPTKRALMAQLPRPAVWRQLNYFQQGSLYDIIGQVARNNMVFRALPNVSGGWTLGPHTRLFTNYFMIRDQLAHSMRLNTVIHSYAVGLQHDIPVGPKGSLQFEFQGRELWQLHQQSVFDFLPGLTFSYILTPRSVLFVNALIQMRGKAPFQAPTKELDPFYTWGGLYQKNGWTFTASTTFVQNFREPFHSFATIPKNSYVIISDFEIARRVMKQYPGLQAFVRAEPIWNFHSHNTPSLAGMDFRLFFGMRFAMAKAALTATLQQIREQLKQEGEPEPGAPGKPSAQVPDNAIVVNPQPIHGFLESDTFAETCKLPEGDGTLIAEGGPAETSESVPLESQEPANTANADSTASDTPASTGRTLDQIAAALPGTGSRTSTGNSESSNNIIDLSNAQLDWNGIESAQSNLADTSNKDELHSILEQAAEKTNSLALEGRSQKILDLAQRQEQEYRIALAPAPLPAVPPKALTALPAPQLKELVAPAPAKLPENSGTKAGSAKIPASHPQSQALSPSIANLAMAKSLQTPELHTSKQVLQPLQSGGKKTESSTFANLEPTSIVAAEKKKLEPALMTPPASRSVNVVPEPVLTNARLHHPSNLLPSGKAAFKPATSAEEKSPTVHTANKDGSIPVTEAKLDVATAKDNAAKTGSSQINGDIIASANIPQLKSVPLAIKPTDTITQQNKQAPTVPQLRSASIPTTAAGSISPTAPQIRTTTATTTSRPSASLTPAAKTGAAPVPKIEIPKVEESIAVSDLSETDISSPKIAMAVYESWLSPVIDDPLIADAKRPASYENVKFNNETASETNNTAKQKQPDKKRTDMHLIPPFPSANPNSKDNPLKNLKLPVLPVR